MGEMSVIWTPFQQPNAISTNGKKSTFDYEPGGGRISQTVGGKKTIYLDDELRRIEEGGEIRWVHNLKVNGHTVAVIQKSSGEADRVSFMHRDLVGNMDVVTDIHGNVLRFNKHSKPTAAYPLRAPYGELLGYVSKTDMKLEGADTTSKAGSYREKFESQSKLGAEAVDLVARIGTVPGKVVSKHFVASSGMTEFVDEYNQLNSDIHTQYTRIDTSKIRGSNLSKTDPIIMVKRYNKVEFTALNKADFQGEAVDHLPGYTGHESLSEHGLVHMNGRVYSPKYGRFLSADSIVPNPQGWSDYNRYMYVLGNPSRYYDPTGHSGEDVHLPIVVIWPTEFEYTDTLLANEQNLRAENHNVISGHDFGFSSEYSPISGSYIDYDSSEFVELYATAGGGEYGLVDDDGSIYLNYAGKSVLSMESGEAEGFYPDQYLIGAGSIKFGLEVIKGGVRASLGGSKFGHRAFTESRKNGSWNIGKHRIGWSGSNGSDVYKFMYRYKQHHYSSGISLIRAHPGAR
jgi:RHS repeat-associated protein